MTNKQKAILGIAVINGLLWSWLFLIDNARLSNSNLVSYITITIVYLIIVSIATAVFWFAIKYLLNSIKINPNWVAVFKIFFIWSFTELAVSWLVSVIWMGRNGSWGSVLPFSSLTPWLMWTSLGYLSRFVGFYGVSASFITALFVCVHPKLRKYALPYLGILVLLSFLSWGIYQKSNGSPIKTTITSRYIDKPGGKIDAGDSQLVVLPEYGLDKIDSRDISNILNSNNPVNIVGSKQTAGTDGYDDILVYGNSQFGFLKTEQKSRLIPGGEYLPMTAEGALKTFSNDTYINFEVTRAVVKGHDKLQPYRFNDQLDVGGAACSSIISTEDYRSLVKQGANLLTNSASLEIFRGSRLFNLGHRGLTKFMAVANARPLLQSSNNWPAFALDQNGGQIAEIQPINSTQVTVNTNNRKTVYTQLGEWTAIVGGLWLIYDLAQKFISKKPKKTKK